jgi:hypothetical protein
MHLHMQISNQASSDLQVHRGGSQAAVYGTEGPVIHAVADYARVLHEDRTQPGGERRSLGRHNSNRQRVEDS